MEIENNRTASLITQNSGQGAPVDKQGNDRANAQPEAQVKASNTTDHFSLTGEARQLKELENQIAAEPVVDTQRVAEIRSAIDQGIFTVNAERIADKMLSLEQALTGAR
ncbi:MAG: flagellar biosynthesis anti-sigma factor FlgM [Thiogranum sp.]|nr:flagellar biosynthesis anti-sigma factor FlgM [Thiogranum sp.]